MIKDVSITIKGIQQDAMDLKSKPEMITQEMAGTYLNKNGNHYIHYKEPVEDRHGTISNTIKVTKNQIEIIKKGPINTHMVFIKDKKTSTYYQTGFGRLLLGISTADIKVEVEEQKIALKISYAMDLNDSHVSDHQLHVNINNINPVSP